MRQALQSGEASKVGQIRARVKYDGQQAEVDGHVEPRKVFGKCRRPMNILKATEGGCDLYEPEQDLGVRRDLHARGDGFPEEIPNAREAAESDGLHRLADTRARVGVQLCAVCCNDGKGYYCTRDCHADVRPRVTLLY